MHETPPPPDPALITMVESDSGNWRVTFDRDIDASGFDDGWLEDLDSGAMSTSDVLMVAPNIWQWTTSGGSVTSGDSWQIAIAQAGVDFPQSGVVA